MRLLEEGFHAGGDGLLGLGGGDEAFEEAEVGVDGEVVVGDEDGAGNGKWRRFLSELGDQDDFAVGA